VRRRPLSDGETEREPSLRQLEESLSEKTPVLGKRKVCRRRKRSVSLVKQVCAPLIDISQQIHLSRRLSAEEILCTLQRKGLLVSATRCG
jgi:hypothetical protein